MAFWREREIAFTFFLPVYATGPLLAWGLQQGKSKHGNRETNLIVQIFGPPFWNELLFQLPVQMERLVILCLLIQLRWL